MRVCPKCGFVDPPHWKHCKFSYYTDSTRLHDFKILHPDLAKKLTVAGATIDDGIYVYRLSKTKQWVERKAIIDMQDKNRFHYEPFEKVPTHFHEGNWKKWHPNQTKLLGDVQK